MTDAGEVLRAPLSREISLVNALALLRAELDQHELTAVMIRGGIGSAAAVQAQLRDSEGSVVADSGGYGIGTQAEASALFEAWQNYWHKKGFSALRSDPELMRLMHPEEITTQFSVKGDAMLFRLAEDYPDCRIACLRFDPFFNAETPIWYPGFARFPWCRQYPIHGDGGYSPYQRYATACGTATGTSENEALLHALLEAVEGDAVSLAFLDWYAGIEAHPRLINSQNLPADLRKLYADAGSVLGCPPLVIDITTDLAIPAYIAIPSRQGPLGVSGEAASMHPGYALERALGELVQAQVAYQNDGSYDARQRRIIADLEEWPVLTRCIVLEPADLAGRGKPARHHPPDWWDPPATDVAGQLAELTHRLAAAGYQGYSLRWTPRRSHVPVLTVLVPGLETFFLAHQGVPVLPTGRGALRLAGH
jgi:ribosomal protein S12 methylthiotransferase accessory factor